MRELAWNRINAHPLVAKGIGIRPEDFAGVSAANFAQQDVELNLALGSSWHNTWLGFWVTVCAFPRRHSHHGAAHGCKKIPTHQSDQQRWRSGDDSPVARDFRCFALLYIRQLQCGHECLLAVWLDCCHCRITCCIEGSQSHVAHNGHRFKVYPLVSGAYTELNLGAGWALIAG